MHPYELTIAQAADLITKRQLSPVELVRSCLERIERLEPRIKAWVTLDPEAALLAAKEAEGELARAGPRSPLHGIPMGVKDIFYTAGVKTTACSKVYADFVPAFDATSVARLKGAGAIILGKTVTTEHAYRDPSPTYNPWDPACTPGGSSSGSAAAVAARMCPAALGSQTVGSVLRPATYNGVVGFKPAHGRISLHGIFPLAPSLDTVGYMARSVEDAALLLQAMAGYDPHDPESADQPVPDYRAALRGPGRRPRIGLVREFYYQQADEEVRAHTDAVAGKLAGAGARVEAVALPTSFAAHEEARGLVLLAEVAAVHRQTFLPDPSRYSPWIREAVEQGLQVLAVDYFHAQRVRWEFQRDLRKTLEGWDALLTPATPGPAPRDRSTTGPPVFQGAWTSAGVTTIALPTGLSRSGLPLAVQLVAPWFAEERLLAVARWCEQALGVNLTPPL